MKVVEKYLSSLSSTDSQRIAKTKLGRFVQAMNGNLAPKIYGRPPDLTSEHGHDTPGSDHSAEPKRFSVSDLADSHDWTQVGRDDIFRGQKAFRDQGYSPYYINSAKAHLLAVLRECWRQGMISGDELARKTDQLRSERVSQDSRRGKHIPMAELEALYELCESDEHITGVRDVAMWSLLTACGLRVSEMAHLTFKDVLLDSQALNVYGKGGTRIEQPVPDYAWGTLQEWIAALSISLKDHRNQNSRIPVNTPIFFRVFSTTKGPRLDFKKGLSENGVRDILTRRCEQAGIDRFSPHDFRRTIIGILFERGEDIRYIQRFARHSKLETTASYDRRSYEQFANFVKSIQVESKNEENTQ